MAIGVFAIAAIAPSCFDNVQMHSSHWIWFFSAYNRTMLWFPRFIDAGRLKCRSQEPPSRFVPLPFSFALLPSVCTPSTRSCYDTRNRIGVVLWNVTLLSPRIMLRMKNVLRPRSVSDTDLCTYIHRAQRLPHSLSRIKRSVSTFFSPFMHRFRLMPSFCDRYRWFTAVCVPNSTISQSKSINNVKISRIWMEENPWAVISPRIFMQIYTYIYAQLWK